MIYSANVAGQPVSIDTSKLPEESIAFALEYGIRQYISDGAAVSKLFQSGERKGEAKTEAEMAEEKAEGVLARVDNLMNGTFTRRTAAERVSPEEKERNAYIRAIFEKACKATGKKLPKAGTPELAALFEGYYTKNKATVDKEVARRMKQTGDDGLDELLAGL